MTQGARAHARRGLASRSGLLIGLLTGCLEDGHPEPIPDAYVWELPPGFPQPVVPDDNPMSAVKVDLGRRLFYDVRLSGNQTQSCGSCHLQALAFTDGCAASLGSTGQAGRRSAPSLANVAYYASVTWANPLLSTLEQHALIPMFGDNPVELGLSGQEATLFARLEQDPDYPALFLAAFPEWNGDIALSTIVRALGAFQRTLSSGNAPYDRFMRGEDPAALDASAQRGLALFHSEKLSCAECHASAIQTEGMVSATAGTFLPLFVNTGLYNLDGQGAYPLSDQGLLELTGESQDMGAFRVPTLRNIARTAPYMHDGSISTLEGVLDHYAAGGRTLTAADVAGVGAESPLKSPLIHGFSLSAQERLDVLAFLESLTDDTFLSDPRFADPFENPEAPEPRAPCASH